MQPQVYYTPISNMPQVGEIKRILGVKKFKSNGYSARNIPCLFHNDNHPSASLHTEMGLFCHAEARWYPWKALAGKLGVEWNTPGKGNFTHKYLTDEVCQKLNERKRIRALQVLAGLYELEFEGQVVSVPDVIEMTGCSAETVSKMTKEGLLNFSANLTPYNTNKKGSNKRKNSNRGRKPKLVRIPTLPELEELLGCDGTRRHYMLEVSDDTDEVKREICSLPVKRAKDKTAQLPWRYLMKAAGVKSKNTIKKYMRQATAIEPDIKTEPLTPATFAAMPETEKEYFSMRKEGWMYLTVGERFFGYSKQKAIAALSLAGSFEGVMVNTRKANIFHYTEMSEAIAEMVDYLKMALILRKAQTQPRKSEWEMLMDDLDTKIEMQKEREKDWKFEMKQMVMA